MVFSSSTPIYLDHHHPTNWQQLQQSNAQQGCSIQNPPQLEISSLPPLPQASSGGGSMIKSGSMVDRARMAKVPQPEACLKCPRCDSTNTKFCYFNNYSLTQPRHFCKTCRRYWTRGGALRSVPVGGGCRRNKRSKNITNNTTNPSKSQVLTTSHDHHHHHQTVPNKSRTGSPSSCSTDNITGHFTQLPPQIPYLATLQSLSNYNLGGNTGMNNNIGGFQPQGFQNIGSGNNGLFPFLANMEMPTSLFPFQNQISHGNSNQGGEVKVEENRGVDSSRQFLGITENTNQYYGGINANLWADHYSGINSSLTTNLV